MLSGAVRSGPSGSPDRRAPRIADKDSIFESDRTSARGLRRQLPQLTRKTWTRDYNEVKSLGWPLNVGSANGTHDVDLRLVRYKYEDGGYMDKWIAPDVHYHSGWYVHVRPTNKEDY